MSTILTYLIITCGISAFFFMWIWYIAQDKCFVLASLYSLLTGATIMLISMVV